MNCVHGLPMEMSCALCADEYATRQFRDDCYIMSDGTNPRQVKVVSSEQEYQEALAKLTRSIDGLRGSVDKLTETTETTRALNPSSGAKISVEGIYRRHDITKEEITNALYDWLGCEPEGGASRKDWPETCEKLGRVLANFANKRGLL